MTTLDFKLPELTPSGKLPTYIILGCYPLIYLDAHGSTLCPDCATESHKDENELDQFKPKSCGVYWEGPPLHCDHCSAEIESAYGDPDSEDE